MKAILKGRFLPFDYEKILFQQFQNCSQGAQSILAYTEDFLRLQVRCNINENDDQQVSRCLN